MGVLSKVLRDQMQNVLAVTTLGHAALKQNWKLFLIQATCLMKQNPEIGYPDRLESLKTITDLEITCQS